MKYFNTKVLSVLAVLFFFLSGNVICWAQDYEKINPTYNIKQDGLSHRFTLMDYNLKEKKKYNQSKTYYWYKAQKIMATQGGSSGSLLSGTYQSFYENDQLCEKGEFRDGLKHGIWKKWSTNGVLIVLQKWKKGRQFGTQINFDAQGKVVKRTRLSRFRKEVKTADTLAILHRNHEKIKILDSTGRVIEIQRFRKHRLHGKQVRFLEDRKREVVYFRKGQQWNLMKKEKSEKEKVKSEKTTKEKKERTIRKPKKSTE